MGSTAITHGESAGLDAAVEDSQAVLTDTAVQGQTLYGTGNALTTNVEVTDLNSIRSAFDFAGNALERNQTLVGDLLLAGEAYTKTALETQAEFLRDVRDFSQGGISAIENASESAIKAYAETTRTDTQQMLDGFRSIALIVAAAWLGLKVLK